MTGLAVMSSDSGAKSGKIVATVGQTAPVGSSLEGQAISAVIPSGTAAGNLDASWRRSTPSVTSCAQALSGSAVVASRAIDWNVVAAIGFSAPGSAGFESLATSAVVVVNTAAGNGNARIGV